MSELFTYKKIGSGSYQLYRTDTKRLIGAVFLRKGNWLAQVAMYDTSGFSVARMADYGTFKSRHEAADEVWICQDSYWTERPYNHGK